MKLTNIQIENFRSIRSLDVDLSDLTIFVGQNDCGKSNILRALNLFFNEETNPGEALNFSDDYNFFASPNRRAKEIIVQITIELPQNYRSTNGDEICWEKRWRAEGKVKDEYFAYRGRVNQRGKLVYDDFEVPSRSRLHSALRNIEFEYVPAIRDDRYFDKLQGRLYKVISEVAEKEFRGSSEAFEKAIGTQLTPLTNEIEEAIRLKTQLSLPKDLSDLFERLEFLSGEQRTSLSNRGDGIKTRHIPLILKFLAEKKQYLRKRGSVPSTFIWGYEEPENNLEFRNSLLMAESFANYASTGLAQLLITTHSPVFYNIVEDHPETNARPLHVALEDEYEGTQVKAPNDLDIDMDTMKALAPQLHKVTERVKREEKAKAEAQTKTSNKDAELYIEGLSDQLVLKKALKVFFHQEARSLSLVTKPNGSGHNYVKDMVMAWAATRKHNPAMPKAAGLVDSDAWSEFGNAVNQQLSPHCKVFFLKPPKHLQDAYKSALVNVDVALEHLYPKKYWDHALSKKWLEKRKPSEYLSASALNEVIDNQVDPEILLSQEWAIFVTHKFKWNKKIAAATYVSELPKTEFFNNFGHLKNVLEQIINFTKP